MILASLAAMVSTVAGSASQAHLQIIPSPHQLEIGRSGHYGCAPTFDSGVRAIRTGYVADGITCLTAAAREGDALALRSLGLMRLRGDYLSQDREQAVGYFYEAALRDDPESMYLLGQAFARGLGVAPDPRLAQFWTARAAANGYRASDAGTR